MNQKFNKYLKIIVPFLFFAIGLFFFLRPTISSRLNYIQTDVGDTIFNNYILEHSFRSVFSPSYNAQTWSPSFFYPEEGTLTYSDNLWGSAFIYWLFRFFFTPNTAFQFWMIIISILNFFSFYLLSRELKINYFFSSIAAFLFAFCLPRSMQMAHQQLLPQFYSIFSLLFFYRFLHSKKIIHFALFSLFLYLQILASVYLGWFLVFSLSILSLTIIFVYYKKISFKYFFNYKILLIAVSFCILLAGTFYPYYLTKKELGPWPYRHVEEMIPRISSYFRMDTKTVFSNFYPEKFLTIGKSTPMGGEHNLFAGFFVYALFAFSVISYFTIRKRSDGSSVSSFVIINLAVFLIITLTSLYFPLSNYSLWKYVYNHIPGAGAIRGVCRIWLISYVFLFIAITYLASFVFQKTKSISVKTILIILGLAACVEQINLNLFYFDKTKNSFIQEEITNIVLSESKNNEIDAFYIRWMSNSAPFFEYQIKAMWASLYSGVPTINGYSGRSPIGYKVVVFPMSNGDISRWLYKDGNPNKIYKILVIEADIVNGTFVVDNQQIFNFHVQKN